MHRSYKEQAICHPINQLLSHDHKESIQLDCHLLKDEFVAKNEYPIRGIKLKSSQGKIGR